MIVMLELTGHSKAAINPLAVASISDQTGNQMGTQFCILTMVSGQKFHVRSTIEQTMQTLNTAMEPSQ